MNWITWVLKGIMTQKASRHLIVTGKAGILEACQRPHCLMLLVYGTQRLLVKGWANCIGVQQIQMKSNVFFFSFLIQGYSNIWRIEIVRWGHLNRKDMKGLPRRSSPMGARRGAVTPTQSWDCHKRASCPSTSCERGELRAARMPPASRWHICI